MAHLHEPYSFILTIVRHLGSTVENIADAMACVASNH